ncbi:MAG: release factor glutamine methyltransferase [Myxococcota bacterium]|jgi:release factor glutamine methyltransferase
MLDSLRALAHRARPHTVTVDGLQLLVPPGVLDPVLFRSGAWFARHVARRVAPGQRLLDLGCGSGIVGLLAQRAGARVVSCDLSPRAVEAAKCNGIADARQGDLFDAVGAERFDVICFNPPYFLGEPSDRGFDRALYGGGRLEVLRRFFDGVGARLRAGGRGWMVLSDRAEAALVLAEEAGWSEETAEVVRGERLSFWCSERMGYFVAD